MTTFLGAFSGKGAGGVDQGDNRQAKTVGQIHQTNGFAIAFRPRHTKIASNAGLGIVAFFMANNHNRTVSQTSQPAHDGMIVSKISIPGQRSVFLEQLLNIVFTVGPIWMACHLTFAPRGELRIKLIEHSMRFLVERLGLGFNVHILIVTAHRAQLFSLAFDFRQRALKFKIVGHVWPLNHDLKPI